MQRTVRSVVPCICLVVRHCIIDFTTYSDVCSPPPPAIDRSTAIHFAAREGHAEMLRVMLEGLPEKQRELLVNQRDIFGITPVYLSLQR